MTKAELVNEIAIKTGYDRVTAMNIVESMMETVKVTVSNGENVFLRGFGTFSSKVRAGKMARNISKNEAIFAPEHKVPHFKPCREFRDQIN